MIFSDLGPQAISKAYVWSFIIAMWVRNQILWIPTCTHNLLSSIEIGTRLVRDWYEIGTRLVRDWYEITAKLKKKGIN